MGDLVGLTHPDDLDYSFEMVAAGDDDDDETAENDSEENVQESPQDKKMSEDKKKSCLMDYDKIFPGAEKDDDGVRGKLKDFKILIKCVPLEIRPADVSTLFSQWGSCFIVDNGCNPGDQWVVLSYSCEDDQTRAILNGNTLILHGHHLKVKEVDELYIGPSPELRRTLPLPKLVTRKIKIGKKNGPAEKEKDQEKEVVEVTDDIVGHLGWGWTLLLFVLCLVPWGRPLLFIFISFGIFCRLRQSFK